MIGSVGDRRNDRDRQGRLARRDRHRVETHDYDVHVEPDEVGHELWQPLGPAIREAMVDDEVLPHPVPALSEPIFQSTNQREYILSRRYPRHPDAVHSPRLLRFRGERRKREAESENDREPDQPHGHLDGGWLAGV